MRHPFDGILRPAAEQAGDTAGFAQPFDPPIFGSRRDALKQFVAGSAVILTFAESLPAGDEGTSPQTKQTPVGGYGRYLVVPRDFRALKTERRTQLGIGGGYFRRMRQKDEQFPKAGFLAWLTKDQAKTLAAQKDVREVLHLTPDDVPGPGKKPDAATQLAVLLIPNGFTKVKPARDSYHDTPALIKAWSKKFPDVKFKASGTTGMMVVIFGPTGMPVSLPGVLKKHPQVVGVQWHGTATTLALGEEGATTKALGEEGGVSTRRLGEEGGRPPLTRARGEAGKTPPGTVSTLALGEEGARGR